MKKYLFLLFGSIMLWSCATTTKQLTPIEMKIMTTKQFDSDYNMVFISAISLLHSDGFLISNTDKETGLINASRQIANENAGASKFLWGFAREASTTQVGFFIQAMNDSLTEVKLTVYEGSINSTVGDSGVETQTTKNSLVQNPEVYNTWFNNLRAEIERRKALQ
jgi:hypothetical protein